jgi:hypothetical protein
MQNLYVSLSQIKRRYTEHDLPSVVIKFTTQAMSALLVNSVISTRDAQYMMIDVKNFYLNRLMVR